ncbi:MAG: hypothetical protein PHR75_03545 [Sulfurovum sp.]|nr:hypothetical protein [Sulfurovum sp.]MDD3601916.1 hypothetical protein [Sulfurovum sp.]
MKNISIFIIITLLSIFLLKTCGKEIQENHANTIESPKKTYLDSPKNTYDIRVEALNIANTIQNPDTYLDSRVNARESAKESVKKSNKRMEEQDKAIKALTK